MENLVFQILVVVIGSAIAAIKFYNDKYTRDDSKLNSIVNDAINYAEQLGREEAKKASKKLAGSEKLAFAVKYIDMIDPNIIKKYGDNLTKIITSKVGSILNNK